MINKILEAKKDRYNRIIELISAYRKPVLCGVIHCSESKKYTAISRFAFDELENELKKLFSKEMVMIENFSSFDDNSILAVLDMDIAEAKFKSNKLEKSHSIGLVFNIRVYDTEADFISKDFKREDLSVYESEIDKGFRSMENKSDEELD